MSDRRETLSKAIASLPPNCNQDDVRKALDPLFLGIPEVTVDFDGLEYFDSGIITPLMVACDKGNVACLDYLEQKYAADTTTTAEHYIGKPLDPSKDDNKNTAMHHAAMSGCATAIPILGRLLALGESMSMMMIDLGAVRNSHGDTPLMMAVTGGHLEFCQIWFDLAVQEQQCTSTTTTSTPEEAARMVLQLPNDSKDTALSLACCHGHIPLVDFLLAYCGVSVESEDVDKCRASLKRMESALHHNSNPALLKQFKGQLDSVGQCVHKLEARRADDTAQQLLLLLETEEESSKQSIVVTKKQQTKKKKQRRKKQGAAVPTIGSKLVDADSTTPSSTRSSDTDENNNSDSVRLTPLADGTMAVRVVQGTTTNHHTDDTTTTTTTIERSPLLTAPMTPQSADAMFRERFQKLAVSTEVDAVMKALCLDVSMLLYTPHGMALNLSPSQLDAIQSILEKQIGAVQGARDIQNRMHDTCHTQNANGFG